MRNEASIYCRHNRGLADLYKLKYRDHQVKVPPFVIWLAGPTGCGKTKLANELAVGYAKMSDPTA